MQWIKFPEPARYAASRDLYSCKIDSATNCNFERERGFRQEEMDLSRRRRRRTIDFRIYLTSVERASPQSSSVRRDALNYLPPSVTEIVVTLYNNARKWCSHTCTFLFLSLFFYENRPLLRLTWHTAPISLSHTENLVLLFPSTVPYVIRARGSHMCERVTQSSGWDFILSLLRLAKSLHAVLPV